MVHIVGTYEKAEMEEGEIYEVVNIKTLKQATPNLRIINLWGINFIDDTHVEAFSSNCIQLQVISTHFIFCPHLELPFGHSRFYVSTTVPKSLVHLSKSYYKGAKI